MRCRQTCGVPRSGRSKVSRSVHAPQACAVRVRWRVALHDRRRGDRDRRAYAEQGGVVRSSVCWFVCLFACWFACLSAFVGVRKITRFCAHCSLITQTFAARMPRRRSSCRHTWRLSGMRSHARTRVCLRDRIRLRLPRVLTFRDAVALTLVMPPTVSLANVIAAMHQRLRARRCTLRVCVLGVPRISGAGEGADSGEEYRRRRHQRRTTRDPLSIAREAPAE